MGRAIAALHAGAGMQINYVRKGHGKPVLLVHGLGGHWRSWQPVIEPLADRRSVVAIDLPGFGRSPALQSPVSLWALADALAEFLDEHDLRGVDAVGSALGGRLLLELARRGDTVGAVVVLGSAGFWRGREARRFERALCILARQLQLVAPWLPGLVARERTRRWLLRSLCARPGPLDAQLVVDELLGYVTPAFHALLRAWARGGAPPGIAQGLARKPVVIGWGREDRLCPPAQALQARQLFPEARLHWFADCGHYPHWDAPLEVARLVLNTTAT